MDGVKRGRERNRRIADFSGVGRAAVDATATQGDWALLFQELLAVLARDCPEPAADDEGILGQLHSLLAAHRSVWHVLQEHWRLVLVTLTCF